MFLLLVEEIPFQSIHRKYEVSSRFAENTNAKHQWSVQSEELALTGSELSLVLGMSNSEPEEVNFEREKILDHEKRKI